MILNQMGCVHLPRLAGQDVDASVTPGRVLCRCGLSQVVSPGSSQGTRWPVWVVGVLWVHQSANYLRTCCALVHPGDHGQNAVLAWWSATAGLCVQPISASMFACWVK